MMITNEWLRFMREQFPAGTRIQLHEMNKPDAGLSPGMTGLLTEIDDAGSFHVKWDNGSTTGLVVGQDSFSVLPPEPHRLKLWMPLTADFYGRDEWNQLDDDPMPMDGGELRRYDALIRKALADYAMPEERDRGLMHWYHDNDGVNLKVQSAVFNVEERGRRLWGVADCMVHGELTPEELEQFKDYLSGQASDGWGEGFEQHAISLEEGDLYVHLWSPDNWEILTEDERFTQKIAPGLPDHCFSVLASTGELILIECGESGFYHSVWSTESREENEELAELYNGRLGVTPAQRRAMEVGSMFGWDVPGTDPREYEDCREQFEPETQDPEDSGPVMSM